MNKEQLFEKLLATAKYILHKDYDKADILWEEIYPKYSLFEKPKWYEDDNLENLYTVIYKSLVYRDLSHPPVDRQDLEEAVSSAKKSS